MKITKFLTILILITGVTIFAQVDRTKMPEPGPAPTIKIGDAQTFTLNNGLQVFVVENHKLPEVSFSVIFNYPPVYEGKDAGLATVTGSLLGTATTTKSKDEIDETVDFMGASLSTSANGVYGNVLKKDVDKFASIIGDVISNAKFTQSELEKIKKQQISAIKAGEKNPSAIAENIKNILNFGKNSPYGEIETEQTVKNISLKKCINFYKSYMLPNVSYMAIVGDITLDEAKDLAKKYFSDWKKGDVPNNKFKSKRAPLIRKVAIVDRPTSVQSVIHITYPVKLKPGAKDGFAASIANAILGGAFVSRLNLNLREKHGYTYGAHSTLKNDIYMGYFDASCEARNVVTDSAVTQFLYEMKKMRTQKVSDEELSRVKKYMIGQFARSLEQPSTIARFAINIARYNLPKDYYKNYLKNLDVVTVDDVYKAAKKYIKPDKAYILVVGNKSEIASKLKNFSLSGKIDYYDASGNKVDPNAEKLPANISVDNVIDKYVNAIGGREKINNIKDETVNMQGTIQGMNLKITVVRKFPNKYYFNLDLGAMQQIQKFDGKNAVVSGMGQTKKLEGEQLEALKEQSEMYPLLRYKDLGIKPELTGLSKVNGKEAYKIKLTYPNGNSSILYIDSSTGLKIREESSRKTPQGEFSTTVDYSDYKDWNGIKYPGKIVQNIGPQTIEMNVTEVKINSGVKDDFFKVD